MPKFFHKNSEYYSQTVSVCSELPMLLCHQCCDIRFNQLFVQMFLEQFQDSPLLSSQLIVTFLTNSSLTFLFTILSVHQSVDPIELYQVRLAYSGYMQPAIQSIHITHFSHTHFSFLRFPHRPKLRMLVFFLLESATARVRFISLFHSTPTLSVQNYYGQRVGTLQVIDAKQILVKYFCGAQAIIVNYFPLKVHNNHKPLLANNISKSNPIWNLVSFLGYETVPQLDIRDKSFHVQLELLILQELTIWYRSPLTNALLSFSW